MKRTELVNHIHGSYLKKQYLEAFLVQSAYIEGLLKIYTDYTYWEKISKIVGLEDKFSGELRNRINKYGLKELIDFLYKSNLIDSEQKRTLHNYREKRNQVLHDLVLQISNMEFDNDLKITCELGNKIIADEKFKKIETVLDELEDRQKKEIHMLPDSTPQI